MNSLSHGADDVQSFLPQLARIEHGAAADEAPAIDVEAVEALPEDADAAARHRDHHVGPQHDDHQQRHEKRGGHGRQVAPDEAPPAALRRRRLLIEQVFVPGHQPFSVEGDPGPNQLLFGNTAFIHANPACGHRQLVEIAVIMGDRHDGGAGSHQLRQQFVVEFAAKFRVLIGRPLVQQQNRPLLQQR